MPAINKLEFFRKRSFLDKFGATFQFLNENAWPFLKAQLVITAPVLIIISVLMNEVSGGLMALISGVQNLKANDIIDLLGLYGLSLLSILVTTALIPTVTYGYMIQYQVLKPKEITISKVMEGFSGKFFNILGFYFLTSLAVVAFGFLIGFTSSVSTDLIGKWVLVFFFLGCTVLLVLTIVLMLGAPSIAFEKGNPIDAFGRVFTLAKSKWLSTFGLVICVGIIGLIISFVFATPRAITFGIEAYLSPNAKSELEVMDEALVNTPLSILFSCLESFGTICLYSLIYIALGFQYFNLVERRESKGLISEIDGINTEEGNTSDEDY